MWFDLSPLDKLSQSLPLSMAILVFLGFFVGILASLFGVGGGFFFTPFFNAVLQLPAGYAVATSMAQIPFQSASAVWVYAKRKTILYKEGFLILLFSLLSSQLMALAVAFLQKSPWANQILFKKISYIDFALLFLYSLLIGSLGIYSIVQGLRTPPKENPKNSGKKPREKNIVAKSIVLGLVYGALSSLLGIGGGFLTVPYFLYVRRTTTVEAVATSLFMLFITTFFATLNYLIHGQVYLMLALLVAFGGIFGAQVGSRLSFKLAPAKIKLSLGTLQLFVMFSYIYLKLLG